MIKPALDAFKSELASAFPDVEKIYTSWPTTEDKEIYPYFLIFNGRARVHRAQYKEVAKLPQNKILYNLGWFEMTIDLNYLSREGEEEDKFTVIEKMADFFGTDLSLSVMRESEVSRDIAYQVAGQDVKANVLIEGYQADESGPDLQAGDRRVIFNLSMYAPRLKIEAPAVWTGYRIDPHISERQTIS